MSASESDSNSDSDFGPQLVVEPIVDEQKQKVISEQGLLTKRKREESENEGKMPQHKKQKLMDDIKIKDSYENSWMHKAIVTHLAFAPKYDFVISASIDGVVKLWKKMEIGIEFVKEYKSHCGSIQCLDVCSDGTLLITVGNDQFCSIFDVVTFDMMTRFKLTNITPNACCWIDSTKVAISDKNSSLIRIYKPMNNKFEPISVENIHPSKTKIVCIKYNAKFGCFVSSDLLGNIEFWSSEDPFDRPSTLSFEYMMETDYGKIYKKRQIIATSMTISNDENFIAIASNDHFVRVFVFKSGKLLFECNESIEEYQAKNNLLYQIDSIEFGKYVSVERQLNKQIMENLKNCNKRWLYSNNIAFGRNDKYLMFSSMMGIKIVSTMDGSLVRLIGKHEAQRFLGIALFEGIANVNFGHSQSQKLSIMNNLDGLNSLNEDPSLFATAFAVDRFYMFSSRTNQSDEHRDVQNERPTRMHSKIATHATHRTLGSKAVIRTTFGDIYIKLFANECPKTVENFTVHSLNGYYSNVIFHRVIRGFMIQTGDPKGDSTGGESIWGEVFEDEFHRSLKHDRPGVVSMANAGKNTNGSQFFITTTEAKWLDNKHTIFGRVTKGMDVVQAIECVKCDKYTKKPIEPIKIINISVEKMT